MAPDAAGVEHPEHAGLRDIAHVLHEQCTLPGMSRETLEATLRGGHGTGMHPLHAAVSSFVEWAQADARRYPHTTGATLDVARDLLIVELAFDSMRTGFAVGTVASFTGQVPIREQQGGGSGGSLEPPGPLS